jgi:hypothetical protein
VLSACCLLFAAYCLRPLRSVALGVHHARLGVDHPRILEQELIQLSARRLLRFEEIMDYILRINRAMRHMQVGTVIRIIRILRMYHKESQPYQVYKN